MGSATVPVAAIGVPPMAFEREDCEPIGALLCARSGRRDADQCARDARDPQNKLNRSRVSARQDAT
jgi:hypothetical protein